MTFFGFTGPTPEQQAELEQKEERLRMEYDVFKHSFVRLFDELSEDQLVTFKLLLRILAGNDNRLLASEWQGMASQALKVRFNICPACDVNHDTEMQSSHPSETPPQEPVQESEEELMRKYHLDDQRDADTHELLGYICTGIEGMKGPCGARYPSIEDRMLKPPEHCSGCFIRMAQG